MKHSKTYKFTIGKQSESIRLKQSGDGLNAIAAIATDELDGSLYEVRPQKEISANGYIKAVSESIRGTEFKANTIDVLITDIYDASNKPLYYKAIIRKEGFESIKAGEYEISVLDDHFIYTENKSSYVTYNYTNGTSETIKEEFYPVYVNGADISLKTIADIDGKYFSVSESSNGDFSFYVKKNNLAYKVKENSILKIRQFNTNDKNAINIYVGPYNYESKVNDGDATYHLKYRKSLPEQYVTRAMSEIVSIDGNYIATKNNNIFDYEINISIVDSLGRVIRRVDNPEKFFHERTVHLRNGMLYAPDIIAIMRDIPNSKIALDYNYVKYNTNNISIDKKQLLDLDYISVGITPDIVSVGDHDVLYSQTVKYYVFNKMGFIEYQNGGSSISSFQRIIGYGFGEYGFSEYGYSGHILKPGTMEDFIRVAVKSYNKTGYSTDGYSIGPYGGSYINTREGLNEISLDGNSPIGYIELCRIYRKDITNLPIVLNNRKAIPIKESSGLRKVHTLSNSVFNVFLGEQTQSFLNAGVVEVYTPNSTKASLMHFSKDKTYSTYHLLYSPDISKANHKFVTDTTKLGFKKDTSKFNFENKDLYAIYGYKDGDWYPLNINKRVHIEAEESIYFKVENYELSRYDFIGVAYGNSVPGRKIRP